MLWKELIPERLRLARTRAGLSQEELAEAVGLTSVSISKFETGRRQPRVSTVERIAHTTNTPLAWFFSEASEPMVKDFHRRLADQLLGFLESEHVGLRALLDAFSETLPALAWTTDDRLNITGCYGSERMESPSRLSSLSIEAELAHRQALRGHPATFCFPHRGRQYVARVGPIRGAEESIVGTLAIAVELPEEASSPNGDRELRLDPCEEVVEALSSEFERMREDVGSLLEALLKRSSQGLDSWPVPAAHLDENFRFRDVSRGLQEWLGVSRAELEGASLVAVFGEPAFRTLEPALRQVRETGTGTTVECVLERPGQSIRAVVVTMAADSRAPDRPLIFLLQDITERHQFDYRLKARGLVLSTLFEQMSNGFGVQVEGRLTYVNPGLCKLLGYEVGTVAGLPLADIVAPHEHQRLLELLRRREAGLPDRFGLTMLKKDGTHLRLQLSATPMIDEKGVVRGSFAVFNELDTAEHLDVLIWTVNEHGEITSISGGEAGRESNYTPVLLSNPAVNQAVLETLEGSSRGRNLRVTQGGIPYLVQVRRLVQGAAGLALRDSTSFEPNHRASRA